MVRAFLTKRRVLGLAFTALVLLVATAVSIGQLTAHPNLTAGCTGVQCQANSQCHLPCVCVENECVINADPPPDGLLAQ